MGAIERAKQDVERDRHWLARQRLRSYLITNGYDPEVLAIIGRISLDMHDEFDAGRMWLLSNATGPEIDAAIETFVTRAGQHPNHIASCLPRSIRLELIDRYPKMVRERIGRYGLMDAIAWRPYQGVEVYKTPWYLVAALLIMVVVACVFGATGAWTIMEWIFG